MVQRAISVGAAACVLFAHAAVAQPGAPGEPTAAARRARYQIKVMEGVLERAVQQGAQIVGAQLRAYAPDLLLFTGPARARGFRLDGYGAFFSVDVPAVRRSMTWSVRTLSQQSVDLSRALQSLKRHVESTPDGRARIELEQALKLVELQVGPAAPPPAPPLAAAATPATARAAAAGPEIEPAVPLPDLRSPMPNLDPGEEYEAQVKLALIDAMLDYGTTLKLGPEEWLTVAARDNEDGLLGGDLAEAVTIVFRIRGSDLAAFRGGSIAREDMRQKVEMREF